MGAPAAARRFGLHIIPDLGAAAFLIWATVTWGAGNRVRFLLTASLVYGGIRLARPAVRRLRGHRTGRK